MIDRVTKASEVLQRYAAGKRNFQRLNLQGQSFKEKDLSGADFSEADIRGTDFSSATLTGVKFVGVKAGLQQTAKARQLFIALALAFMSAIAATTGGAVTGILLGSGNLFAIFIGIVVFISILLFLALTVLQGAEAASSAVALALAVFGITTSSVVLAGFAVAISAWIGGGFFSFFIVMGITTAGNVLFQTNISLTDVSFWIAIVVSFSINVLWSSVAIYVSKQAVMQDRKFAPILESAVAFSTRDGTSFYKATLTDANFSEAALKGTNFREAMITRTVWKDAKEIDYACFENSVLSQACIRQLVVCQNGYGENYETLDFHELYLEDVNLQEANLKQVNLNGAVLRKARLQGANFKGVQAIGTDFSEAKLTGATLEAWNIDATTNLKNVDCQYIFLLEHSNADGLRERRPRDPDTVFQPGDFTKLYTKMTDVVQLLLRDGLNPDAFRQAFAQLMAENPEITPESIQAIEKKGNDVLVTIEVPETTDKGKVERRFTEAYVAGLEAQVARLEGKVARLEGKVEVYERGQELFTLAFSARQPPPVNVTTKYLSTINYPFWYAQCLAIPCFRG